MVGTIIIDFRNRRDYKKINQLKPYNKAQLENHYCKITLEGHDFCHKTKKIDLINYFLKKKHILKKRSHFIEEIKKNQVYNHNPR